MVSSSFTPLQSQPALCKVNFILEQMLSSMHCSGYRKYPLKTE